MAQLVGYMENNVRYEQGPFVVVPCLDMRECRIEVELKDYMCPVLPDTSVYEMLEREQAKKPGKVPYEECCKYVDWLNQQVRAGRIILIDGRWIAE